MTNQSILFLYTILTATIFSCNKKDKNIKSNFNIQGEFISCAN